MFCTMLRRWTSSHLSLFAPVPNARHSTHSMCSRHTPRHVGHVSQVGPLYGGSHLHVPHWHVPLPLHSTWLWAIQEAVSMEQLQSSSVHSASQTHVPHMHRPWPPHILLDQTLSFKYASDCSVRQRSWAETIIYRTCCCCMDTQSCCIRRSVRCIFPRGLLGCHTHRSPPHIPLCRCTPEHSGLSDRRLHPVKKTTPCLSGTVFQRRARDTRTGHTLEPHGRRNRGCFLRGFLCRRTDLEGVVVLGALWICGYINVIHLCTGWFSQTPSNRLHGSEVVLTFQRYV